MSRLIAIVVVLPLMGLGSEGQTPRIVVGSGNLGNCGRFVHYVRAVYPKDAKRRGIQGVVRFRVEIDKKGLLRKIELVKGDPILVPAALRAVKQWRYAPCIFNGETIEMITEIQVNFTLSQ